MQPISLQNRSLLGRSPLLGTGNAGAAGATRQPNVLSAGNAGNAGAGQFDMMSLLLPILQLVTMALGMMMGGSGSPAGAKAPSEAGPGGASYGGVPAGGGSGGSPSGEVPAKTGGPGNAHSGNANQNAGDEGVVGNGGNGDPGSKRLPSETNPETEAVAGNPGTADAEGSVGNAQNLSINDRRNIDYSDLKADPNGGDDYENVRGGKQAFNGVSGQEAAIMHLGGRGHISGGTTENGVSGSAKIYNNVLNNPGNFTPDEVELIQGYAATEQEKYGYFTGEGLDHDFVDQMAARGGISDDKLSEYHQAIDDRVAKMVNNPDQEAVAAEAGEEVNIVDDVDVLEQQSGLNKYEQAVYRLSGHSTLFSGDGSIDGDILAITLGNKNSLDGRGAPAANSNIDPETLSLLQDDLASDGELNGDSLRFANEKVLDKIFMGGPDVTEEVTRTNAVEQGEQNGRSKQDIMTSLQTSANDAMRQFGDFVSDHPVITAMGAGAMGAAAGVCPFLSGTMAVGAGMAAGSKMFSDEAKPSGGGGY